jgi:hypothetical protein
MDVSRRQAINAPTDRPGFGPPNQFHHMREYPSADFRAVVRPNFDTLYSSAWLDLTAGPVLLGAPDTGNRFFMLPLIDMWTGVFANPGKRTPVRGNRLTSSRHPWYTGALPDGVAVIASPTPYV